MPNDFDGTHVRAELYNGRPVKILLDYDLLTDSLGRLLLSRIWKRAIVCRGRFRGGIVEATIRAGIPIVLDVFEPNCASLIDALERDQFEVRQALAREREEEIQRQKFAQNSGANARTHGFLERFSN